MVESRLNENAGINTGRSIQTTQLEYEDEVVKKILLSHPSEDDEHRLGLIETSVSFVSTIMGGGVVSVPYAYTTAGFRTGFII